MKSVSHFPYKVTLPENDRHHIIGLCLCVAAIAARSISRSVNSLARSLHCGSLATETAGQTYLNIKTLFLFVNASETQIFGFKVLTVYTMCGRV